MARSRSVRVVAAVTLCGAILAIMSPGAVPQARPPVAETTAVPIQPDALAQELLSRGLENGKRHADTGANMEQRLTDPSSAWLMLLMTLPSKADATRINGAIQAQPRNIQDRLLRVYADGCMLGFEREKFVLQKARQPVHRSDKENLKKIAFMLGMYTIESDGWLPCASDAKALQAVLYGSPSLENLPEKRIMGDKQTWISEETQAPLHWNAVLSGRQMYKIRGWKGKVALYQDPPAPDGNRWVLLLDLETVRRVGPAEWTRLRRGSGIPGPDVMPPRYRITYFACPPGMVDPRPVAINNKGEVTGYVSTKSDVFHAVVWRNGRVQDQGVIGMGIGINDKGHVVGDTDQPRGKGRVFLWRNGRVTLIGLPGGQCTAIGINERDWCVGHIESAGGDRAFEWKGGGSPIYLTTLGGRKGAARGINARGDVVGESQTASGKTRATLWHNGKPRDLGSLGTNSYAQDINERGLVAGWSETEDGHFAFLWSNGKMRKLPLPKGYIGSEGLRLNKWGAVVGSAWTNSGGEAVLWRNGVMYRLNRCIPSGVKLRLDHADDINDKGWIIGEGVVPGPKYVTRPFLLTPM